MTKALFCEVDVQNDFVAGSLAVPQVLDGERLGNMLKLSKQAPVLIGSVDSHDFRAWEFSTNDNVGPDGEDPRFPPHCVVGTWGWLRVQPDDRSDVVFIPDQPLSESRLKQKLQDTRSIFLMKEVYSLFANPNAEYILRQTLTGLETNKVVVYGIATDYCVSAAVEGFLKAGVEVIVAADAIGAVDPAMGHVFVKKWAAQANVSLMSTEAILKEFAS